MKELRMKEVVLEEDKSYYIDDLKKKYGENVGECLERLVREIAVRIKLWLRVVYRAELHELGVRPPEIKVEGDKKRVTFYGFAGRLKCGGVTIKISPKVGEQGFLKMLEEVSVSFNEMAISLPAYRLRNFWLSEILVGSVQGANLALLYSPLVLKISKRFLLHRFVSPQRFTVLSEHEIGKLHVAKTSKLQSLGIPMGAFIRLRQTEDVIILTLLKKLNLTILNDLKKLIKILKDINYLNSGESSVFYEMRSYIKRHLELVQHPLFRNMPTMQVTDEVLKKAQELRRRSVLASAIVELYVHYRNKRELMKELTDGDYQIISSHKLYEFWILSSILKYLKAQGWEVSKTVISLKRDIKFELTKNNDNILIKYEKPIKSKFTRWGIGKIRPDLILRRGSTSYPIEVKYKSEIDERDIRQALHYMAEISQPYLFVAFAYLGKSDEWRSNTHITIRRCRAHPLEDVDFPCLLGPILGSF